MSLHTADESWSQQINSWSERGPFPFPDRGCSHRPSSYSVSLDMIQSDQSKGHGQVVACTTLPFPGGKKQLWVHFPNTIVQPPYNCSFPPGRELAPGHQCSPSSARGAAVQGTDCLDSRLRLGRLLSCFSLNLSLSQTKLCSRAH